MSLVPWSFQILLVLKANDREEQLWSHPVFANRCKTLNETNGVVVGKLSTDVLRSQLQQRAIYVRVYLIDLRDVSLAIVNSRDLLGATKSYFCVESLVIVVIIGNRTFYNSCHRHFVVWLTTVIFSFGHLRYQILITIIHHVRKILLL